MPINVNLTYRANLANPLTWAQGDANFKMLADNDVFLNNAVEAAQQTADGKQTENPKLSAIAGSVWAANQILYITGTNTVVTKPVNEYSIGLLTSDSALSFKIALSLDNVNNTSDVNKPISTAMQTALDGKINNSQKGVANGVASLGVDTKVPAAQLPLGTANGAASLGSDGKLPVSQLPPLAVNEVFTVASQAAMLALTAERGDVAVRSDQTGLAYILATDDPTVLANWKPLDQALSVSLAALNTLTPAADRIPIFTGAATAALQVVTAIGKALMSAVDAAAARLDILAAKSGANNDITSLTGLTTPLSLLQGGTGKTSIGAAAVGAVAQSAGIPTGAIIEYTPAGLIPGTQGDCIRYADGTQICTVTVTGAVVVSAGNGALFNSSALGAGIKWAKAFKSGTVPRCSPPAVRLSTGFCVGTPLSADATATDIPIFFIFTTTANSGTNYSYSIIAIGQWY